MCLLAGATAAQEAPARCALLGQVTTSAFLGFADALGSGDPDQVAAASALLNNSANTYKTLECDTQALGRAIDCVLTTPADAGRRAAARSCLAAEGIAQGG